MFINIIRPIINRNGISNSIKINRVPVLWGGDWFRLHNLGINNRIHTKIKNGVDYKNENRKSKYKRINKPGIQPTDNNNRGNGKFKNKHKRIWIYNPNNS